MADDRRKDNYPYHPSRSALPQQSSPFPPQSPRPHSITGASPVPLPAPAAGPLPPHGNADPLELLDIISEFVEEQSSGVATTDPGLQFSSHSPGGPTNLSPLVFSAHDHPYGQIPNILVPPSAPTGHRVIPDFTSPTTPFPPEQPEDRTPLGNTLGPDRIPPAPLQAPEAFHHFLSSSAVQQPNREMPRPHSSSTDRYTAWSASTVRGPPRPPTPVAMNPLSLLEVGSEVTLTTHPECLPLFNSSLQASPVSTDNCSVYNIPIQHSGIHEGVIPFSINVGWHPPSHPRPSPGDGLGVSTKKRHRSEDMNALREPSRPAQRRRLQSFPNLDSTMEVLTSSQESTSVTSTESDTPQPACPLVDALSERTSPGYSTIDPDVRHTLGFIHQVKEAGMGASEGDPSRTFIQLHNSTSSRPPPAPSIVSPRPLLPRMPPHTAPRMPLSPAPVVSVVADHHVFPHGAPLVTPPPAPFAGYSDTMLPHQRHPTSTLSQSPRRASHTYDQSSTTYTETNTTSLTHLHPHSLNSPIVPPGLPVSIATTAATRLPGFPGGCIVAPTGASPTQASNAQRARRDGRPPAQRPTAPRRRKVHQETTPDFHDLQSAALHRGVPTGNDTAHGSAYLGQSPGPPQSDTRPPSAYGSSSSETAADATGDRKERRRAQNRRAAQRSREKKRDRANRVVQDYRRLQSSNTSLQYQVAQLCRERDELSNVINDHLSGCTRHGQLPLSRGHQSQGRTGAGEAEVEATSSGSGGKATKRSRSRRRRNYPAPTRTATSGSSYSNSLNTFSPEPPTAPLNHITSAGCDTPEDIDLSGQLLLGQPRVDWTAHAHHQPSNSVAAEGIPVVNSHAVVTFANNFPVTTSLSTLTTSNRMSPAARGRMLSLPSVSSRTRSRSLNKGHSESELLELFSEPLDLGYDEADVFASDSNDEGGT